MPSSPRRRSSTTAARSRAPFRRACSPAPRQGLSGAFFWDATAEVFAIYDRRGRRSGQRTTLPTDPTGGNSAFLAALRSSTPRGGHRTSTTCRDAHAGARARTACRRAPSSSCSPTPTDQDVVVRVDAASHGLRPCSPTAGESDRRRRRHQRPSRRSARRSSSRGRQVLRRARGWHLHHRHDKRGASFPAAYLVDEEPRPDVLSRRSSEAGGAPDEAELWAVSSEFGEGAYTNVVLARRPRPKRSSRWPSSRALGRVAPVRRTATTAAWKTSRSASTERVTSFTSPPSC